MNLSLWTEKRSGATLLVIFLQTFLWWPPARLCAQSTDALASAPTLLERMHKTLPRQMDSVGAMQRSVTAQQQTANRQLGEVFETGFFTLPGPAPMSPSSLHRLVPDENTEDSENNDDSHGDNEGAGQEKSSAETGASGTRIQVPWKSVTPVPALIASPIAVGVIDGISAAEDSFGAARPLSLEGILLQQLGAANRGLAPVQDRKDKENSSGNNTLPRTPGAADYLRQMLGFSIDGSLLQGLSANQ